MNGPITKEVLEQIKKDMHRDFLLASDNVSKVNDEIRYKRAEESKAIAQIASTKELKAAGLQFAFGEKEDPLTIKARKLNKTCNQLHFYGKTVDAMINTFDVSKPASSVNLAGVYQFLQYVWSHYEYPIDDILKCYGQFVCYNNDLLQEKGRSAVSTAEATAVLANYFNPDGSFKFNEDINSFEGILGHLIAFTNRGERINAFGEITHNGTTMRKVFTESLNVYNQSIKGPEIIIEKPLVEDGDNHIFFIEVEDRPLISYDIQEADSALRKKYLEILQKEIVKENENNFKTFEFGGNYDKKSYAVVNEDLTVFFVRLEKGIYALVGGALTGTKFHDMSVRIYEYYDQINAFGYLLQNPAKRAELMASQKEKFDAIVQALETNRRVA